MNTEHTTAHTPPGSMEPPEELSMPTDLAAVRSAMSDLERQARELIDERPVLAVMIAAGIGYLLARVVVRGGR